MDLADRGESDACNDPKHVEEGRQVGLGDFPCPRREQHGYGRGGLEHLDERHREVQVDDIGADEGARVKDTDGKDRSAVDTGGKGEFFARIEEGRRSSENLRCNGSEDKVPAGEKNG